MTPDLTAIVVGHDVRDEVLQCLDALAEHRGGLTLEVIVVDNASNDGTSEAVRRTSWLLKDQQAQPSPISASSFLTTPAIALGVPAQLRRSNV